MNKKINFKQILSLKNQGFVAGMVLSLVVMVLGFSLIKNIKTNQQQASAEQVGSSPESGVKSRISELYDALVAKNYGSDTDNSGLAGNLGTDWGTKWNRIKTAALKPGSGGAGGGSSAPVASGVKSVQRGYFAGSSNNSTISINPVNLSKSVLIIDKAGGSVSGLVTGGYGKSQVTGHVNLGSAQLNSNHIAVSTAGYTGYRWSRDRDDYVSETYYYASPFAWQVIEYY